MKNIRWHYTTGNRMQKILASGEIRQATVGVPKREKPAVWFSTGQDWEPTANKFIMSASHGFIRLNREQTELLDGGLCRIGVAPEAAPHNWDAHKRLSGIAAGYARDLYNVAIAQGSHPRQWFVSYSTVPRNLWLSAEFYDGGQWVPLTNELLEMGSQRTREFAKAVVNKEQSLISQNWQNLSGFGAKA